MENITFIFSLRIQPVVCYRRRECDDAADPVIPTYYIVHWYLVSTVFFHEQFSTPTHRNISTDALGVRWTRAISYWLSSAGQRCIVKAAEIRGHVIRINSSKAGIVRIIPHCASARAFHYCRYVNRVCVGASSYTMGLLIFFFSVFFFSFPSTFYHDTAIYYKANRKYAFYARLVISPTIIHQ